MVVYLAWVFPSMDNDHDWSVVGRGGVSCGRVYDFAAKTFWAKVETGRNVNSEKAYLVESWFKNKLKL